MPAHATRSILCRMEDRERMEAAGAEPAVASHPESLVARTQLTERLRAAASVPLVLLIAPAGYGKTTVLRQWAAQDARPFARVALTDEHDAPGRLEAIAAAAFAQATGPSVLTLDDVHALRAPASLAALTTLLDAIPDGSQLVLAGRTEPALPIGRLRAHRRLFELRTADLAMTQTEGAALLSGAGLALPPDAVATLVRRTEGWPAGLYLAALSVREQDDAAAAAAGFGGDDRLVAEYLRDELLAGLPADARRFLVRTSILERLSGPLCDAVLATTGSGRMLTELAAATLLLIPLDRTGARYRCHRLLGDLLRSELRRTEPERRRALRRRASAWHAARGEVEPAIRHAVAAQAVDQAGALLWEHAARWIGDGRNAQVERWLGRFAPADIAASPPLALTAALSRFAAGERTAADHWARSASSALALLAPRDDRGPLPTDAALLRALTAHGDVAQATAATGPTARWRALACLFDGVARQLAERPAEARTLLEEGARRAAVGAPLVQALCLSQLALVAIDEGDWHGGALLSMRAANRVRPTPLAGYPTAALVLAVAAAAHAQRGRVEEATRDAALATQLLDGLEDDFLPWYEAEARIALARAALRLSDVGRARRLLGEADRLIGGAPGARALRRWHDELRAQADVVNDGDWTLTTAELRVLQLLPTHLSYPDIARRLFVSPNTVKTHARAVYRKLAASSRAEAVGRARDAGLLDVTEAA